MSQEWHSVDSEISRMCRLLRWAVERARKKEGAVILMIPLVWVSQDGILFLKLTMAVKRRL